MINIMTGKTLIIEIPYGGLGDHLFHSHIPRIAKEVGGYQQVYISNKSLYRHPDNKKLVWDLNPYIDGFTEKSGKSCDLEAIVKKLGKLKNSETNLLDEIMFHYSLDDGERSHEPEVYYEPKFIEEYHKIIYDPNYLSCVGAVNSNYMMLFLEKKGIYFDAIMKLRNQNALYEPNDDDDFINTKTLFAFCDLVHSSKKLYCLTSGTATLAAALRKPAVVFYGDFQPKGYQHSKLHQYCLIERSFVNKTMDKIKEPYRRLRRRLDKNK